MAHKNAIFGKRNVRRRQARALIAAACASAVVSMATAASGDAAPAAHQDAFAHLPETLTLTGTVRDFRAGWQSNPHPDFQRRPMDSSGAGRFGHYVQIVAPELGADGKPVFRSGGRRVIANAHDAEGRKIMPAEGHIASVSGDAPAQLDGVGSAVVSAESFRQWYRDVPGVNASRALDVTLVREEGTNRYVFDDKTDPVYAARGGFFPINGELYGDFQNGKNFHFTYELATEFQFHRGAGQVFRFVGDDDVWVYIDGKLVIDLGGIHGAIDQTIDLDRLEWLEDGGTYTLHFFFAERHTTQSNFRIETTLRLKSLEMPPTTALFD